MASRKRAPEGYREVEVGRGPADTFTVTVRGIKGGRRFDDKITLSRTTEHAPAIMELLRKHGTEVDENRVIAISPQELPF